MRWWGSAVTFFVGGIGAWQHDLKALLAYSTISQLGAIMFLYGPGRLKMSVLPRFIYSITRRSRSAFSPGQDHRTSGGNP
jgi:NADH:ubiquinone oxidoreductase subunit 5 (subunit L)/multisubunit Na+/H+ antiporter MnhA subunit